MNPPASTGSVSERTYEPISYTAGEILRKRAWYTTIPHAQQMADAAGVKWRISPARAWAQRVAWGLPRSGLYLQFRHDAISAALSAYPGSAVLEIGAGFGTRGLAESAEREAYVESDLRELIAQKRRLVESVLSGSPRRNHHFIDFNACSTADMQRAERFILDLGLRRPLVIVNEGILMYLSDDEQRAFRDNVRGILARSSPRGAWITTDFSERDYEDGFFQKLMARRLTRRVKRGFNRFPSDQAVSEFLAGGGFRGTKLANVKERDPDRSVREVADSFRAWVITLEPGTAHS